MVEVKISPWIQAGFNLFKENFGLLVLVSLVAVLLGSVTMGILAGPMMCGVLLVTMNLAEGRSPKPQFGDLFKGFSYFLDSLLFVVVWGIIMIIGSLILNIVPILGQIASLFFVYALQALLMFGLFLVIDRKMGFWPASMESINMVKQNFWPFLGFGIIAAIIGSLGAILCGIGVILTLPIQACIMTVAYKDVFGGPPVPPPFQG